MELRETVYLESQPEVDAEAGVIRNVKLLGENSKNSRKYTREALTGAVSLYKGRKIYIDHPRGVEGERSYDRWAGTISESRLGSDGIYGDVKLRKKSDFFDGIIEAAQEFPKDVGFSHVADGESHLDGDTEIVESIRTVFSVDLVTDPATTSGFFESRQPAMKRKQKTAKEIAEGAPKDTKFRSLLVEQMGDGGAISPDMAVDVPEEPDPAEEVKAALEKAAVAVIKKLFAGDLEQAAAFAEIKKILGMKEKAGVENDGPETPAEPATESANTATRLARLEAENLLMREGREASEVHIQAVAAAPDASRKALVESWPKKGDSGQDSPQHPRPDRSPGILESTTGADFPRDAAKFAAALR